MISCTYIQGGKGIDPFSIIIVVVVVVVVVIEW